MCFGRPALEAAGEALALGMRRTEPRCVMATALCLPVLRLKPPPVYAVTITRGSSALLTSWVSSQHKPCGLFHSTPKTIPAYVAACEMAGRERVLPEAGGL